LAFFLRGHTRAREGEGLGKLDVSAVQECRDGVTRRGDAGRAGGILGRYFDEAACRQGVQSFFHGEVEVAPAGGQIVDDLLSFWTKIFMYITIIDPH
jgi:hypothetical protein